MVPYGVQRNLSGEETKRTNRVRGRDSTLRFGELNSPRQQVGSCRAGLNADAATELWSAPETRIIGGRDLGASRGRSSECTRETDPAASSAGSSNQMIADELSISEETSEPVSALATQASTGTIAPVFLSA
jgi:hypothetical protein